MSYWQALAIIVAFGSTGGLIYGIVSLLNSGKTGNEFQIAKEVPLLAFFLGRCAVGVGGAAAIVLVLITTKHYPDKADSSGMLFLSTSCLVAGFIGHEILPAVAARMQRQIAEEVERKTQEVKKDVERKTEEVKREAVREATEKGKIYSDVNLDIGMAVQALSAKEKDPKIIERRVAELEEDRTRLPRNRTLHIVLARVYDELLGNFDKAVETLKTFVQEKESKNEYDMDFADALYNIACYYAKRMAKSESVEEKKVLRDVALNALKRSISTWPSNAKDAKYEKDLSALQDDPEFKALIG